METQPSPTPSVPPRSWKKPVLITFGVVLACCGLTAAATGWWVKHNIYASPHAQAQLTAEEQARLDEKLQAVENPDASRTLSISEKEINAFLAKQGVGEQLKIELGRNAVAANLLIPIDENAPLFAGTTLRLKVALGTHMDEAGKLVVKVNDVSVGGVPLPNAWLGDIKGIDLIAGNVGSDPALQRFAAGIKEFNVENGALRLVLND